MMDLESYNRSFEEHVDIIEEEAENRLRTFRQQCVRNFIHNFTEHQAEWNKAFNDILCKSQEIDVQAQSKLLEDTKSLEQALNLKFGLTEEKKSPEISKALQPIKEENESSICQETNNNDVIDANIKPDQHKHALVKTKPPEIEPFPKELSDYFTNKLLVNEFVKIQSQLDSDRQQFDDINTDDLNTDPALKPFKQQITLFIRTQINSISNSDREHLNTKTRMLSLLFSGQQVSFQDRFVQANPKGQLYAMHLAAQTFVTVGTRLVNSVPAIARSMAIVINGVVVNYNIQHFKNLIVGNLQERCPYLVPLYPRRDDFDQNQPDSEVRYKIACGYSYDSRTQSLESEEKYLARMRCMVLIYACFLAEQEDKSQAWTWLASFLSLKPEPVITATILQAYLQEISKPMSRTFGRQYRKLLEFIRTDFVRMIEQVTPKTSEQQSLIKLKNLMADESSLHCWKN